MKKLTGMLLSVSMVLSLAACSQVSEPETTAQQKQTTAAEQGSAGAGAGAAADTKAEGEGDPLNVSGEIVVWYSGDSESRVELYEWAKGEIEKTYPGTKVTLEVIPMAELSTAQMTACKSGNGPDVMSQSNAVTNGFMKQGLLEPIQDLMKRAGRDLEAEFNTSFFESMREGDDIYGVPQSRTALALAYNKDMFKEAGIEKAPATWAKVRECAEKLTKKDAGGNTVVYGFGLPGKGGSHLWFRIMPEIWGCGGDICDADIKTATLDSDATRKALEYYTSYYFDGLSPDSMLESDQTAISQMFAAGSVAMTIENISWIEKNVVEKGLFDVGIALYPGENGTNTAGLGGWNACIPASAKNKEGAAAFIDLVTNAEGMDKQLKMPALTATLEEGGWTGDFYGPYTEMLREHSREFPEFENAAQAQTIIMNMIQSVLSGGKIDQAVTDANSEIQALLDAQNAK